MDRVKERWTELRMVPHALAQKLNWTPEIGFKDYDPSREEIETVANMHPPAKQPVNSRSWEGKTIWCVGRKCSRKATHGDPGVDRLPRFCVLHRLEGMFELGPWRPTFKMGDGNSGPRDLPL